MSGHARRRTRRLAAVIVAEARARDAAKVERQLLALRDVAEREHWTLADVAATIAEIIDGGWLAEAWVPWMPDAEAVA